MICIPRVKFCWLESRFLMPFFDLKETSIRITECWFYGTAFKLGRLVIHVLYIKPKLPFSHNDEEE